MQNKCGFVLFLLCMSNVVSGLGYRMPLGTITRWSPSFSTLHELKVWYRPIKQTTPLPKAKKVFCFLHGEHLRVLAGLDSVAPRTALQKLLQSDVRDFCTYVADCIINFTEHKTKKNQTFSLLVKMSPAIKSVVITVNLFRNTTQKICGDVTIHGYLKEPPEYLVRLVTATMIDDSFFQTQWRKVFGLFGIGFAWFLKGKLRDNGLLSPQSVRDSAVQTEEEALPREDVPGFMSQEPVLGGSSLVDAEAQTEEELRAQQQKAAVVDVEIQTDEIRQSGGRERRYAVVGGRQEDDLMPEINIGALYRAIGEACDNKIWRESSEMRRKLFVFGSRYDFPDPAEGCVFIRDNTCILDDGSLWFTCGTGSARVVIYKNLEMYDIECLLQERDRGEVKSDVILVLFCIDATAQKKENVGRFVCEKFEQLKKKIDALRPRLKGFDIKFIVKNKRKVEPGLFFFKEKEPFSWSFADCIETKESSENRPFLKPYFRTDSSYYFFCRVALFIRECYLPHFYDEFRRKSKNDRDES